MRTHRRGKKETQRYDFNHPTIDEVLKFFELDTFLERYSKLFKAIVGIQQNFPISSLTQIHFWQLTMLKPILSRDQTYTSEYSLGGAKM